MQDRSNENQSPAQEQNQSDALPQQLRPTRLVRTLSLMYKDPFTGDPTDLDPVSFTGEERKQREDAVLNDLPASGYASGIAARRAQEGSQEYALISELDQKPSFRGPGF